MHKVEEGKIVLELNQTLDEVRRRRQRRDRPAAEVDRRRRDQGR